MEEINPEYLTIKSSVTIPALQALVNGCFYGLASGGVVAVANSMQLLDIPPWAVGVTVGALSGLYAWRGLLDDWRGLLYGVDDGTYIPPERDIGPATMQPVQVELLSENGNRGQYANLPASPEQLIELGRGIASGDSFSVSRWTGSHGGFSRGEFEALRGELLKLGWLEWRSDRSNSQGVEITKAGGAVFRHFASMSTSPPRIRR